MAPKFLTREQILGADDIKTETVRCPEWGGDVLVKSMSGADRDAFEQSIVNGKGEVVLHENIRAAILVRTIVGPDKKPLFTAGDIAALGEKSAAALDRCFTVAQRLNGMTPKDVAELAGNSDAGPSGASTSA